MSVSARYQGPRALGMASRLRGVARRALRLSETDPVRTLGLQWYTLAASWLRTLAEERSLSFSAVAGACAALSPQVSWLDQTRFLGPFLDSVLRGETHLPHPGFLRNRERAARIILGADPVKVLGGPKVTAFYACLCGDVDRVCVDRHAATVALGRRQEDLSPMLVAEIQRAYRYAARSLGLAPRDLQSLLWCHYKASGKAEEHEAPTLFDGPSCGPSITDLALGWSNDVARAFDAPAEYAPDVRAPTIEPSVSADPLPF